MARYTRTIDTAERQGLDPDGGKYVVICEGHSTIVNVRTLALACTTMTTDFCESCREEEATAPPA